MANMLYSWNYPLYEDGMEVGMYAASSEGSGYMSSENQTIEGSKIFIEPPKSQYDPTADTDAATVNYLKSFTDISTSWNATFDDDLSALKGAAVRASTLPANSPITHINIQASKSNGCVTLSIPTFYAKPTQSSTFIKTTGSSNIPTGFRPPYPMDFSVPIQWSSLDLTVQAPRMPIDVAQAGIGWGELLENFMTLVDTIMSLWGYLKPTADSETDTYNQEIGTMTIDVDGSISIRRSIKVATWPTTYTPQAQLGWGYGTKTQGSNIVVTYSL